MREIAEGRGIQSIDIGMRVLDVFVAKARPLKLSDIAALAEMTSAQAHAYLASFRRQGLIERDNVDGSYRLGELALRLGIARIRSADPVYSAIEAANVLKTRTGLTVSISVWGSFGPTAIYVAYGLDQMIINSRAGTIYSITGTATGLAYAANMPERIVRRMVAAQMHVEAYTPLVGAVRSYENSADRLAQIRSCGFATIDPLTLPGILAIAVPVFDFTGDIRMAITLIGPVSGLDADPAGPQVRALLDCRRELCEQLGFFDT
jgi:DNA-binding IclR family transcriptional regulator